MADIILSQGVRANLLSLQQTADMMSLTQNRLATGRKVNTALDNPNSYFTSQSLNNRANDLSALLDSIGQAIQTIKAADTGVTAITKLVEAAKAKANQALQTSDTFERSDFVNEYNELRDQIAALAQDSGYNGKNLLAGTGNELTVYFNEDNSNSLTIGAINYTDVATSLGLPALNAATLGTTTIPLTDGTDPLSLSDTVASDTANFATPPSTLTFSDADGNTIGTVDITEDMTVGDLLSEINDNFDNVRASFSGGQLVIETTEDVTMTGGASGGGFDNVTVAATSSDWQTETDIEATLDLINTARDSLRQQSSTLGTSLTVVQNRQDFTKSFVGTLTSGADMLTVADTNEEGANLLALQTRQSLSTTALSLASQADQSVLKLFG